MDNLEEMERYLEKISLPRLNQEETEIMNSPITNTETVIKNLLKNKSPGPDGFTGKFYKTFREELMPVFLQRKEYLQTHSMKPQSPQYQNQEKTT